MSNVETLRFRCHLKAGDPEAIRALASRTGFFSPAEIEIAEELACDTLLRGAEAGYHFIVAEEGNRLVGYCCFGHTPCTVHSFDLYWIAVDPEQQGRNLGSKLMDDAEREIRRLGGARVYADTSGRAQYAPTRGFYQHCGYVVDAVLDDFYAPGDAKVVYRKVLT